MSHFANDVHHRLSTRISEIIPDFVESEYPAFVAFLKAYYEFLEQYDELPVTSTYAQQPGVVTVQAGVSTIIGANTQFANTSVYANNVQFRVGSDQFRVRSIANNTHLTVYEVPVRSYFANTHAVEVNKSIRQASGAARQLLTIHDVEHTLDDFIAYFRDTYLRDIPQGLTDTKTLLPRILDFYQSRGSEESYAFLFRALYDKDVAFSYPRDSVFTTSDNEYTRPIILRIANETADTTSNDALILQGNSALLETREIVGLTSNARATVLQTATAYEGASRVLRTFISEPIISRELGGILLEDGSQLLVTKYGVPPEGLASQVYTHALIQEFVKTSTFLAGETISTIPTNDPNSIRGVLLGSITGFTIENRGAGYQLGELVYPPARYANGEIATAGFGAVGRIAAFTDVDITQLNVNDPGLGYYAGLKLVVDNTGTGGGSGLSGYVANVSPGHLTLHADPAASIADGDVLTFVYDDEQSYRASLEKIDYYQVGISLADLVGGLLLNDAANPENDGRDLADETTGRQLLQESAIQLNQVSWNTNTSSAIYGANLQSTIIGLTSNFSTYPIYVNGVRTELGEINHVTMESFGSGYVAGLPTISVQTPTTPTKDVDGALPLTYNEIFGEGFHTADVSVQKEVGQIGQVDVLTGGSGYINTPFVVNTFTSTTRTGANAELGLILGAISYGIPYFKNTRSFASADQYMQDITKYQPFSYVLTVEESLSRYSDILRRLVHPAGGLLLPRQTITTELDLVSSITLGSLNLTLQIVEDPTATPPSLYTIHVTAPEVGFGIVVPVGTNTIQMSTSGVTAKFPIYLNAGAVSIRVSNEESAEYLNIPVAANMITVSNEEETTYIDVPVQSNVITLTAPQERELLNLLVNVASLDVTAPTATAYASIVLPITYDTILTGYNSQVIQGYETTPLTAVVDWRSASIEIDAPTTS